MAAPDRFCVVPTSPRVDAPAVLTRQWAASPSLIILSRTCLFLLGRVSRPYPPPFPDCDRRGTTLVRGRETTPREAKYRAYRTWFLLLASSGVATRTSPRPPG